MTTLTQSDLDDLRQKVKSAWVTLDDAGDYLNAIRPTIVIALLDHIAQLTAALDEAKAECKAEASRAEVAEDYFNDAAKGLLARIAVLEAALLKSDALQDLAYADGAHRALVASNGGAPEEKIMAMISDRRHSSLVELKRLRENPSIAELEAKYMPGHTDMMVSPESLDEFMKNNPLPPDTESQPSAQFVAGMMRAAEIARTFGDVYGACDFIASDILAEAAALKGEGK